jgi:pyruvate formate lyase activating enzyme
MNAEAQFWKTENEKIRCLLCPHQCLIGEGQYGICNVRQHVQQKLITRAYNNLCALAIDPVEKKPLYHFMPGTKTFSIAMAGCNLKCKNCQNSHISQEVEHLGYDFPPHYIVENALEKKCPSVSFTYTEPTVFYEYMLETAKLAHENGLKNIMVSNGYINREPLLQLIPYVDAANIDIKAFDEETYKNLTGGSLQPVLDTVKTLMQHSVHVELTYLLVPSFSDDIKQITAFVDWLISNNMQTVPLHFSRFFPSFQLEHLPPTPTEHVLAAVYLAKSKGIHYVYAGNMDDVDNNTYCHSCRTLLIEREHYQIKRMNLEHGTCKKCGRKLFL